MKYSSLIHTFTVEIVNETLDPCILQSMGLVAGVLRST